MGTQWWAALAPRPLWRLIRFNGVLVTVTTDWSWPGPTISCGSYPASKFERQLLAVQLDASADSTRPKAATDERRLLGVHSDK